MMVVLAALLAISPAPVSAEPARASGWQPMASVSATAEVRIRIISAASFGQDHSGQEAVGGQRRAAMIDDGTGRERPAELLEFQ